MANIYFPDYPEKLNPAANDLGLLADSEDLDIDGNPKFKSYKLGNQDIDINVTENTLSMGGNSNNIVDSAITQDATKITIPRSTYIPGAVDRIMLFGTTEATASPDNTIFEYIGDVAVMTNLDQSVRIFTNDQELRIDTFNNTAAGEPRLVACKIRGTIQNQESLIVGDVAGTLEIAGSIEQAGNVYPRALLMIRTIVDDVAAANGYMPTKTVFYNRKVGGADNTRPDEAGHIDKLNNFVWGTVTPPSDSFPPAVGYFKGNNQGFVKLNIGDTGGSNLHDEHLIWSEDTNAGRGDTFWYINPIDGSVMRQGDAILRIRNGTSVGQTARISCDGNNAVFQVPRVTPATRDAMTGLIGGEIIFNTDSMTHQGYNGTAWTDMY